MKVKILKTYDKAGIKLGQILSSEDFSIQFLQALCPSFAIEIQDNELYSSEVDKWQAKSYPPKYLVNNKNCQYRSNCNTSETWVRGEWGLECGAEPYEEVEYSKDNQTIKENSIYKANKNTSDTWVTTEWDLILQGSN